MPATRSGSRSSRGATPSGGSVAASRSRSSASEAVVAAAAAAVEAAAAASPAPSSGASAASSGTTGSSSSLAVGATPAASAPVAPAPDAAPPAEAASPAAPAPVVPAPVPSRRFGLPSPIRKRRSRGRAHPTPPVTPPPPPAADPAAANPLAALAGLPPAALAALIQAVTTSAGAATPAAAPVAPPAPAAVAPVAAVAADVADDDDWAPETAEPTGARTGVGSGAPSPHGAGPASGAAGVGRGAAPRAAFSGAAVDAVYNGCPSIEGFDLLSRLTRPGTFPVPFKPTGDTDYTAEFGNGGRNAIEAHVLYMGCAWLRNLNNSLADWEAAAADERPTYAATAALHASARTHVYQIYHILATRYEVLLRWRSDAAYAASLHSAVLEANHTSFTNAATAGFHEIASRDRATHVARAQGRALANIHPPAGEWGLPPPAWSRGGGNLRRGTPRLRPRRPGRGRGAGKIKKPGVQTPPPPPAA